MRLLDVAELMERSLPDDASSDGIHFDRPKGTEWLNGVFQRHINLLELDLLETAQLTFGLPPIPPFFAPRPLSSRLGARVDSRDNSRSSQTRQPGSTPVEAEEAESSTPQSSLVSWVVVVDNKRVEKPAGASKTRYLERVKELDLEDLECRQRLARTMETADLTGIPLKTIMGPINYSRLKQLGSPGLVVEPPKHRTSIDQGDNSRTVESVGEVA